MFKIYCIFSKVVKYIIYQIQHEFPDSDEIVNLFYSWWFLDLDIHDCEQFTVTSVVPLRKQLGFVKMLSSILSSLNNLAKSFFPQLFEILIRLLWAINRCLKEKEKVQSVLINPFVPSAPFLYPPKCFQGLEKGCIGNEWVKTAEPFFLFIYLFFSFPYTRFYTFYSQIKKH